MFRILDSRERYIDFLRYISLIYMVFQHAMLVLLKNIHNYRITFFIFELVPLCPAMFLFVSGLSFILTLKQEHVLNNDKFIKKIRYGFLLILGGCVLFLFEQGLQLPDMIFASSILNTIGIFIIISSLIYRFTSKKIQLFLSVTFSIITTFIYTVLMITSSSVFPLTNGYEPILPTIIFGFYGLSLGDIYYRHNRHKKIVLLLVGIVSMIGVAFMFYRFGGLKMFFSEVSRYIVTRRFDRYLSLEGVLSRVQSNTFILAKIWNYNIIGFYGSLFVTILLFILTVYFKKIFNNNLFKYLLVPAVFPLYNYFVHLIVIAIAVLLVGYNQLNFVESYLLFGTLIIFVYLLSYLILILKQNRFSKKVETHQ